MRLESNLMNRGASLPTVRSFRSHLPYTLPSSVSRKSFACHSYANTRGVYPKFPVRNSLLTTRHSALDRREGVLLTNNLLTTGGVSHGFIHIAVDLFAGIALALIAALQVLKVILENLRAGLAQAFSRSLVQRGFGLFLGRTIRMLTELHDSIVSAPIFLILPLPLSPDCLLHVFNQN